MPAAAAIGAGRITAVETLTAHVGFRNLIFVRVHTESGHSGVGEATLEWHDAEVRCAIDKLAQRYLIGGTANRIEHYWQIMFRGAYWRGGPVHLTALSALDQALWDIKGKVAGLPVYELIGGPCRDYLDTYANGPRGRGPSDYASSAARLVESGFTALKISAVRPTQAAASAAELDHTVEVVAAIREKIGRHIRMAVDVHGRLSPAMAIRCAGRLEPYDIWFIEEPTLPDNDTALARVAEATTIPLASGERWLTRQDFDQPLASGALAIIQPDVAHCGGISELRRIAAMAEFRQVAFAPHNPLGPVATAAAAHVSIATPNFLALEMARGDSGDWTDSLVHSTHQFDNSRFVVSPAPGLGVTLNDDAIAQHPAADTAVPAWRHPDGGFAEW